MVPMTIKVSIFSLFILLNQTLSSHGSNITSQYDLPISINEMHLTAISDLDHPENHAHRGWEHFAMPDCQYAGRFLIGNPDADQPTTSKNAKPWITRNKAADSPSSHWNFDSLGQEYLWSVTTRLWGTTKLLLSASWNSSRFHCLEFLRSVVCSATDSIQSFSWQVVQRNATASIRKLLAAPHVIQNRTATTDRAVTSASELTTTRSAHNNHAFESSNMNDSLIKLPEDSQDSYWQYYEDCDRWGVHFAGLVELGQDNLLDEKRDVEVADNREIETERIGPHFSIPRLISLQNVSTWLYPWPRIKSHSSDLILRWLRLVEFNVVEGAETEFVLVTNSHNQSDLASLQPVSSKELIDILNSYRQGLITRFSNDIEQFSTRLKFIARVFSDKARNQPRTRTSKIEPVEHDSFNN